MDRCIILEKYLRDKRKLSDTTKDAYAQSIQCLFAFCPKEIQEMTSEDILSFLKYLRDIKLCSPATIRIRFSAVKSFFIYLIEEEFICTNPTTGIRGPKLERKKPPSMDPSVIFHLRDATNDNLLLRTLIEVLYCTGLRVSELINIKIKDIYLDDNAILITRAKGNTQKFAIFTYECRCLLESYIESRKHHDECPFLFMNQHKRKLTRQGVNYLLKKISDKQIDSHIYPHLFRHHLANRLIEQGATIHETANILGHKNLNNTRRYAQFSSEARKKNYDKYF
jgi:site-specific recombinase XerD